ncbi:MAG: heavy metal translocating P-type ATPase [Pseudomonadales bacterium]|nr:heavy metal translocating P-type ATPase [Pseudomonadales bacterium]
MSPYRRWLNFFLLATASLTLVAGLLLAARGQMVLAVYLWLLGALPVMLVLLAGMVKALARGEGGLDLLAVIAMGGAAALGESLTAEVIALMLASGRVLESYAEGRAQREMTALLQRVPASARRYEHGQLVQVPLDAIQIGDRMVVRSGEVLPVDGTLLGPAELDEATLTGESVPVHYAAGQMVRSGTLNAGTAFDLLATTTAAASTLAGIVRLVQSAQGSRAPAARLADRYALLFVPLALGMAGFAWLLSGQVMRALAVLVVATPCPLLLAVPVAIVSGMSCCARRGILIKNGGALERLARTQIIFFDKTGTLTGGRARLVNIEVSPDQVATRVLQLAASLDQASNHVIAEAVVLAAREKGLVLSLPSGLEERPGAGISGIVDGQHVAVGTFDYVAEGVDIPDWALRLLPRMGQDGSSGVFVAAGGVLAGVLLLADEIRLETPRALRQLRAAGVRRAVMLTGDNTDVAEAIGSALGVQEVMARQSPAGKLAAIATAKTQGVTVMVGDGVNDAPALASADVGVAMGVRGAAAAAEAADVILLVDRLDRLAEAIHIARHTRRIAIQSVMLGMSLSLLAMLVAALGWLPPLAGAILQEFIDVLAILNALRALRLPGARHSQVLSAANMLALKEEHQALRPVLETLSHLADHISALPGPDIVTALRGLNMALASQLLPHERQDDQELYPGLAPMLGGDDPMAAMSRMHREIFQLTRRLAQLSTNLEPKGPDTAGLTEIRRNLYSLDAILKLHFAQEEEIYDALSETVQGAK